MLDTLYNGFAGLVGTLNDLMYSYVLIILLLAAGVYFTIRTAGVQVRLLGESVRVVSEKSGDTKAVSAFEALMVSTASRVGTGNIVGVANAIAIPLTGWLARRMGEGRLYFWSTFLFVVASFLCGISSSLGMLIICRILQGAAAGPLIPLSQSLLLACYPREKRGIALSLWSMTIVLAPILGPILGGYICDNYTWNWIFFVNVPVGAVCLVALRIPMADHCESLNAAAAAAVLLWEAYRAEEGM